MSDIQDQMLKARRETIRFQLLRCLHISAPEGMNPKGMLPIIAATYKDVTQAEIGKHLDYLHQRELVHLSADPLGNQSAKLARYGFDVVEYAVDCDAGIARPSKA